MLKSFTNKITKMKKVILLSCVMLVGFFMLTGQVIDNGQKNSNKGVDGSYIWNFHKLQKWYQQQGLTQPSSYPLARPKIIPFLFLDGIDLLDVQVFPSSNHQTENSIGINPINSNNLMVSVNELNSQPYFFTTNGGSNWFGAEANPNNMANYGDPVAFFNMSGKAFWSTLADPGGIGFASTTNNGVTWVTLANGDPSVSVNDDKQHAVCDLSGVYPNNVYTAWSDFTNASNPPLYINRSTNQGVSWGTKINIGLALPHFNHGVTLSTGPNGEVYVAWADYATGNLPETGMGFTKSTNGGVSYNTASTIFTMTGIRATNSGLPELNNTRGNSFPKMDVDRSTGPRRGWIYITYPDKSTGDADVYLRRSSDGGTTWSTAIRVNSETVGNGKQQWMPSVAVDASSGALGVSYYSMDTTGFLTARYTATSLDGGTTWDRTRVSDVRFTPSPLPYPYASGYCGDYYETAAGGGSVWACWSDNRTGSYFQAYTSKLTLGPGIMHTPLGNTEQTTLTRLVSCTIATSGSGINPSLTKLYYAKNSTTWINVNMTNSGSTWTADIPLSGAGTYNYYITTTDSLSRTATSPAGAPTSYYSFAAGPDITNPVIVTTPLADVPKTLWPATVTATVTDNIGIDTVWVKWYKNNTGTGIKEFKLLNTGSSSFGAAFNSLNADVAVNDSIFYRVFAQDISTNHNRDSSALLKFKIIQLTNICVGAGTVSSNYPFATYWGGARTQMLFTAAEITAAGGIINALVAKIGFNIISADPGIMNGFNINIQNTALTTLSTYVNSGWTNIYTGTYTVPGTGWQYIDCPSSTFHWNGTNLLLEVCYTNPSYTQYSTVYATTMTGMQLGYYMDGITGCSTASVNTVTARPNVCFTMSTVTGANNQYTEVPTKYELSQNYPNPFNPVTKINFALPKQGFVTLKIYDVLGREVKTLVNEIKSAGQYSVDFNASEFSSGVYFYKLETNGFSNIKRMMLIK